MRVLSLGRGMLALVLSCTTIPALAERIVPRADAADSAIVAEAPSPSARHRALVDALIANDSEAVATTTSERTQEQLAQEWERDRLRRSEPDRPPYIDAEAERLWSLLRTPEGTAELAAELHPKLIEQANTQVIAFNLGFAAMLSSLASSEDFSPEEVQQLSQLVLAVQRWANGMDWQDRARFDRALDAMAGLVRRSGAKTASEISLLPYEEALAFGDDAIATAKRVLLAYDLDLDAMLASVEIEELSRDGDRATVRWSARVLDVPIRIVRELGYDRRYGGRWMTAQEVEQVDEIERWHAEEGAAAEYEPAPEAMPSDDTGSCGKGAGDPESAKQWSAKGQ